MGAMVGDGFRPMAAIAQRMAPERSVPHNEEEFLQRRGKPRANTPLWAPAPRRQSPVRRNLDYCLDGGRHGPIAPWRGPLRLPRDGG